MISFGHKDNYFNYFSIEESERPVKLDRHVIGYQYTGNSFLFSRKLTYELPNIVKKILSQQTSNKQILVSKSLFSNYLRQFCQLQLKLICSYFCSVKLKIFCQSRNDVESSLNQLKSIRLDINGNHRLALRSVAERCSLFFLRSTQKITLTEIHHLLQKSN